MRKGRRVSGELSGLSGEGGGMAGWVEDGLGGR